MEAKFTLGAIIQENDSQIGPNNYKYLAFILKNSGMHMTLNHRVGRLVLTPNFS